MYAILFWKFSFRNKEKFFKKIKDKDRSLSGSYESITTKI